MAVAAEVGMQDECVVSSTDSCCTTADQKCFLLNFPQMMSPRLCISLFASRRLFSVLLLSFLKRVYARRAARINSIFSPLAVRWCHQLDRELSKIRHGWKNNNPVPQKASRAAPALKSPLGAMITVVPNTPPHSVLWWWWWWALPWHVQNGSPGWDTVSEKAWASDSHYLHPSVQWVLMLCGWKRRSGLSLKLDCPKSRKARLLGRCNHRSRCMQGQRAAPPCITVSRARCAARSLLQLCVTSLFSLVLRRSQTVEIIYFIILFYM